jgi:hypothetical protein
VGGGDRGAHCRSSFVVRFACRVAWSFNMPNVCRVRNGRGFARGSWLWFLVRGFGFDRSAGCVEAREVFCLADRVRGLLCSWFWFASVRNRSGFVTVRGFGSWLLLERCAARGHENLEIFVMSRPHVSA